MSSGVRFTKPEREALTMALDALIRSKGNAPVTGHAARLRAAESALHKIELSELSGPKKKGEPGIGWAAAASAMGEVLGERLVLPPSPTGEWCGRMSSRIRDWGLSTEDCTKIAQAAKGWRTPAISFETLVYKALQLLKEEPTLTPFKPKLAGPLGMND